MIHKALWRTYSSEVEVNLLLQVY